MYTILVAILLLQRGLESKSTAKENTNSKTSSNDADNEEESSDGFGQFFAKIFESLSTTTDENKATRRSNSEINLIDDSTINTLTNELKEIINPTDLTQTWIEGPAKLQKLFDKYYDILKKWAQDVFEKVKKSTMEQYMKTRLDTSKIFSPLMNVLSLGKEDPSGSIVSSVSKLLFK